MGKIEFEKEKTYARKIPLLHYSAYYTMPWPKEGIRSQLPTNVIGSKDVRKNKVKIEWEDVKEKEVVNRSGEKYGH